MSADLRARLDSAAKTSGRSIADEIRTRVELSFMRDVLMDEQTLEFLDGLALMPPEIERETGGVWHKHAGSFAVFKEAILKRLSRLKPEGSFAFGKRPHQAVPLDDPEGIGSWIEMQLNTDPTFTSSRLRQELERSHRQMMELNRKKRGDRK